MFCNCKSPTEHAEHLRQETDLHRRLFPVSILYSVIVPQEALAHLKETSKTISDILENREPDQEGNAFVIELSHDEWCDYLAEKLD